MGNPCVEGGAGRPSGRGRSWRPLSVRARLKAAGDRRRPGLAQKDGYGIETRCGTSELADAKKAEPGCAGGRPEHVVVGCLQVQAAPDGEQRGPVDGKAGGLGGAAGGLGTFDAAQHELEAGRVGEGIGQPALDMQGPHRGEVTLDRLVGERRGKVGREQL